MSHVELCHVSVSRLPGSCTCGAWWTGRWADLLAASHRQDHHRDDDEVQHGEGNHLQHLPGDIHSVTYNIHGCYHSFTSEYWYRYNVVLRCYLKEAYKMLLLDLDQANRNNFYFKAKLVRPETERGQVSEASHHTHTHLFNFPLSPYRVLLKIKWFSFSWLQAWWFWLSLFCLHTVICDLTTNKEESTHHLGVTSRPKYKCLLKYTFYEGRINEWAVLYSIHYTQTFTRKLMYPGWILCWPWIDENCSAKEEC